MFPQAVFNVLIVGALALVAISIVALLGLILRDHRNKELW